MLRAEIEGIVRDMMTPAESVPFGSLNMYSIINQGIVELSKKLGGVYKESTLNMSTNGDGTVDLPEDLLNIDRFEKDDVRMTRINFEAIRDSGNTGSLPGSETGTYWYMRGRGAIGTWQPVTSGTIAIYYEGFYTVIDIEDVDAALSIPTDWEDALIQWTAWKVFERQPKGLLRAQYHKQNFDSAIAVAMPLKQRHRGHRGYSETTQR